MSSRITSLFGTLGERVGATEDGVPAEGTPPRRGQPTPQERLVPQGRWVEYTDPTHGPMPALLVAWQRSAASEPWWARIVVTDQPGEAAELLVAGHLVRPAPAAGPT